MSETIKSENRKHEFIITAMNLFYQKGYDNTTIKDIIDELRVSKGAFYYYFESKEDIMISIAKEFANRGAKIIRKIILRTDLSTLEKMNETFMAINIYKINESETRKRLKSVIKGEENLKLQNKVWLHIKDSMIGLFEELIDSGVKEGVFGDMVNSREMAEFFLNTIQSLNSSIDELEKELHEKQGQDDEQKVLAQVDEKVKFYEVMLGRMFQLREGSFHMLEAYRKRVREG